MATDVKNRAGRRRANPDYLLMATVAALLAVGLMAVYSATFDWSYQAHQNSFAIAGRQFLWVGLGVVAMIAVAATPYGRWRAWALPIMGGATFLLLLVLLIGGDRFGARRAFLNGSIQPSELAKPAIVIYVAAWLASRGDQIRDVKYGLIPFAVLIGLVAGLIVLEPDMSTAILVVLTALAMFFFAGADVLQLAGAGLVGGVTFFTLLNQLPYARQRMDDYLAFWRDPMSVGHHVQQSLIALGSGGLWGVGIGQSQQKLGYLPAPHTDSIFAVWGEETGILGCLLVVGLFALLAWRGFQITSQAPDAFAALLACGVTCWLIFQALANMGVITGLLPFTGVALPFISFGGSSMVISLIGVGLLLSVSGGNRRVRESGGRRSRDSMDYGRRNGGARLSRPGRGAGVGRAR